MSVNVETIFSPEKIKEYYEQFKYYELSFNGDTVNALGLILREIYLSLGDKRYAAKIQKASMTGVEVVVSLSKEDAENLRGGDEVFLNFSFMGLKSLLIPVSFGVAYIAETERGVLPLTSGSNLLTLHNKHNPPGYLIGAFGDLIQQRIKESKRKEERIGINELSCQKLGLKSPQTHIVYAGVKKECVLRDISFSGAQILLSESDLGEAKEGTIEMFFRNPDMFFEITGTVKRKQLIPGSTSNYSIGLHFNEKSVPEKYKMRIHRLFDESLQFS